jgi:acyl-coenzyme A synthetase/AMP-(fatty) acid ligase
MNLKTHPATTFGRRNFVDVIDEIASSEPSRPVVFLPRSENAEDGWEELTFGKYANSINRFARWIVERVGHAKDGDYPTVAYIGPNDIRYLIVLAASIKAGYKVSISLLRILGSETHVLSQSRPFLFPLAIISRASCLCFKRPIVSG